MPETQNSRQRRLFLLGGLLGVLVFLLLFGVSTLNVTNDAFCRGGYIEKDIQQHYAGWLFYRASPLSFPLDIALGINAPHGLSIAYTDSIPLLTALLRPVSSFLPATFQFFGWFTLVCFFLQGGFAALLLGLFAEGAVLPLVGSLLFVTSPVLFERVFRHTSLAAQFLLLAALYYYFLSRRENRYRYAGLFLLNILAVGIHPYFLPMTYAITFALLLSYAIDNRKFAGPLLYLAADLAATVFLGYCLGLFYGKADSGGQALYGYFAMNLNALWNPVGVAGDGYSLFLPVQNLVGGNYDAFAYLGLGVLLVLPLSFFILLVQRRLDCFKILRRHGCLLLVCCILTAFAISHTITANGATLAVLPLPAFLIKLCSVFRSGGRMFWAVYYLLFLVAFVFLTRILQGKKVFQYGAVACMVLLQLVDISPLLIGRSAAMRQATESAAFPSKLESSFWQEAARYKHIVSMDSIQDDALHLALYAADNGMTTNDPFAARYDETALQAQRAALSAEISTGTLREDTLYLYEYEGDFLQAVAPVSDLAWCGRVSSADQSCNWYVIAPGLQDFTPDALCTVYDENYPLRLADYTDGLWNRGVLDSTKKTVCFADSPFTRGKLEHATGLCADGNVYPILSFDDHDAGWLMLTLEIDDATVLWDKELTTQ